MFTEEQLKLYVKSFMDEINKGLFSEEGVIKIFKTLIESMNEGLVVTDKKGIIFFNNKRIAEIMQYEYDNFKGHNIVDLIGTEILNHYNKNDNKNCSFEMETMTSKGKKKSLFVGQSTLFGKSNKSELYVLSVTDITKRVNSEKKLKKAVEFAKNLLIVDSLTGLYNYRYFEQRIAQECERSLRYNNHLCLLMIDIDLFKVFNDTNGHCFGDFILKEISNIFTKSCRSVDIVFRYGGDEFSILLPNTNYDGAIRYSDKMREIVKNHRFEKNEKFIKTTISLGLASYLEDNFRNKNDFIESADEALFVAKKRGGNTTVIFKDVKDQNMGDNMKLLNKLGNHSGNEIFNNIYDSPESIITLIKALETKDPYSEKHSVKVMNYALLLAERMKLSEREIDIIKNASLMHDVGKIGVSDSILLKKGKLNNQEFMEIKKHPEIGVKMLKHIRFLNKSIPCILHHHEWFNGRGYPDGLKEEEIPIGARIIAVADAFDAMTTLRPYRGPLPMNYAISEIINGSGKQFCPDVVDNFLEIIKDKFEFKDRVLSKEQTCNILIDSDYKVFA